MKTKLLLLVKLTVSIQIALCCTGCKIFLPAHPNSLVKEGKLKIVPIETAKVLKSTAPFDLEFVNGFQEAFGEEPGGFSDKTPAIAAALASAAVGIAVDQVAKELEREAKQYEAQFTAERLVTDFWSEASQNADWKPKYCGVRLVRERVDRGMTNELFEFVVGWTQVKSAGLWVAKPLKFQTRKAKAKVISGKWYHQLLVAPWLLRYPGSKVTSEVEIEMIGHYREGQLQKELPMGILKFKFEDYDLNTTKVLSVADGSLEKEESGGPFNSAPISVSHDKTLMLGPNRGMFTITARVTEADVSNVAKPIERAGKFVADQKKDLQQRAEDALKP